MRQEYDMDRVLAALDQQSAPRGTSRAMKEVVNLCLKRREDNARTNYIEDAYHRGVREAYGTILWTIKDAYGTHFFE